MGIACRAPRANSILSWGRQTQWSFLLQKKICHYLKPRLAAGHIATKIKNIIFRHHFTSSVVSISNYSEKLHEA